MFTTLPPAIISQALDWSLVSAETWLQTVTVKRQGHSGARMGKSYCQVTYTTIKFAEIRKIVNFDLVERSLSKIEVSQWEADSAHL